MSDSLKVQPKRDVNLGLNCIICEDTTIEGDVTIGNGTIVHPRACIIAEAGPIVIGEHNLIEDKAMIINSGESNSGSTSVMIIGNYNVFEVGSRCESLKIGDYNVLEAKSVVGRQVVLSNHCIVGAGCTVTHPKILDENSAFYGPNCSLRLSKSNQTHLLQMDFLRKLLPNYHYLVKKKKPNTKTSSSSS
ncbi:hypothetical protein RUM44_005525 [Polyplax serrata]|uniref:Dynactin subunit 6 n=1 Tax=Polyplax serrata TaxID=468196 RepID=A0ABR1ADM6_POLSC